MRVEFSYTISGPEDEDLEAQVQADVRIGRPGIHTLKNGDPGWPDEPDEVEIISVSVGGEELDEDLWDYAREAIAEKAAETAREGVDDARWQAEEDRGRGN